MPLSPPQSSCPLPPSPSHPPTQPPALFIPLPPCLHAATFLIHAFRCTFCRFYFVHSFRALPTAGNKEWVLSLTDYGASADAAFISSVQRGRVCGCQFHPEKSGDNGLSLISAFLKQASNDAAPVINPTPAGES